MKKKLHARHDSHAVYDDELKKIWCSDVQELSSDAEQVLRERQDTSQLCNVLR